MKEGVSVIVCCYNSEKRLPRTLDFLLQQDLPKNIAWEVIVVDNDSTDMTSQVANNVSILFQAKSIGYKVTVEHEKGLGAARKKGVNDSIYDIIIFCDDDNWLEKNYIFQSYLIMKKNSSIGVLGGCGIPKSDIDLPVWFYSNASSYAVGVQSQCSGDISSRGYVWGAGMVLRAIVIKQTMIKYDLILSGRKGNEMLAGDDTEICKWYLLAGYMLWYDEKLIFWHYISVNRLTIESLNKVLEGFQRSSIILNAYNVRIQRNNIKSVFIEIMPNPHKLYSFIQSQRFYYKLDGETRKKIKNISLYISKKIPLN